MKRHFQGYIEPTELYRTNEGFYNSPSCQGTMIEDKERTLAFQKAITGKTKKDFTVLDFGAGSGILSMFAAQAEAKKVYAVEWSRMAPIAEKIIQENNLNQIIQIANEDIRKTNFPKVDLLMSECLGHLGYDEDTVGIFLDVRNKLLKKGGQIIPENLTLFLAPTNFSKIHRENIKPWKKEKYSFNFQSLGKKAMNHIYVVPIEQQFLISDGKKINTCDLKTAKNYDFQTKVEFRTNKKTRIYGLCGWWESRLSEKVILSTAPDKLLTHWEQCFLPIAPTKVEKNDLVTVLFSIKRLKHSRVKFSWIVSIGNYKSTHLCVV